jgi:hypothetical protein
LLEDQFGNIFYAEHTLDWEVLSTPEEVANVSVPAGSYPASSLYLQFVGSPNFVVTPSFEYTQGAFFNGSKRSVKGEIDLRPNKYFLLSAIYQNIKLSFPNASDQIIQLARLQANVIFSPQLSWNNIAQFDSQSNSCGFFSRLRYEIEPGQEAFLVVNQGFDVSDDFRWTRADGNLSLKLGMTYFF